VAFQEKVDSFVSKPHGREVFEQEMRRASAFKEKALDAGMVRPFLLLVSMDYTTRNQVATMLGFSIFNQEYLGDAHAEAWDILDSNIKGIRRRASETYESLNVFAHNANWYETVYRCGKEVFKKLNAPSRSYRKTIEACKDSGKRGAVCELEEEFVKKLSALMMAQMTREQVVALEELEDADDVREIAKNMRDAGIRSSEVVRHGIAAVSNAVRLGGFNTYILTVKVAAAMNRKLGLKIVMSQATKTVARAAAALNVAAWVWLGWDVLDWIFGSSHGRLFPVVAQLLNQRLYLAAERLDIADYY